MLSNDDRGLGISYFSTSYSIEVRIFLMLPGLPLSIQQMPTFKREKYLKIYVHAHINCNSFLYGSYVCTGSLHEGIFTPEIVNAAESRVNHV